MRLRSLVIAAAFAFVLSARAFGQIVVQRDDFESGYGQWTMTGMWNAETSTDPCGGLLPPFPSGSHCVYFGNDTVCNYALGTAAHHGELTWSTPLSIPAAGHVTLRFWDWREAECFNDHVPALYSLYDRTTVQASTHGGATWTALGEPCENFPVMHPYAANSTWHPHDVDLTSYQGQQLLVRFVFNTVDGNFNNFFGWAIDDVSLLVDASTTSCFAAAQGCPCNQVLPFVPILFPIVACQNSTRVLGELLATGSSAVSQDTFRLRALHLPPGSMVMFFQGTSASTGTTFGDGRLCLNGPFCRLAIESSSNGEASYPSGSQSGIASIGGIPATGGTRGYQAFYRDPASYCTSATFNLTSAFEATWVP